MDNLTIGDPRDFDKTDNSLKILIVDDEDLFRRSITRVLDKNGFTTLSVGDGEECLRAIDDNADISLILLDQMMPGLTIHQILKRIKHKPKKIPILITSGFPKSGVEPWLEDRALDFLQKPFGKEELLTKINTLVKNKVSSN